MVDKSFSNVALIKAMASTGILHFQAFARNKTDISLKIIFEEKNPIFEECDKTIKTINFSNCNP